MGGKNQAGKGADGVAEGGWGVVTAIYTDIREGLAEPTAKGKERLH